jgi:molecular chaperone DnaK
VNVQAKDKGTGKEQKITITASSGLSKEEVERMMKDAESHSAEDRARKEEVETRNRGDQAIYVAEKFLRESGEKLEATDRMAIESAVSDAKKALESNDATAINRTLDALMQAQQKAAENLYRKSGDAGAPGGNGKAEDVIDAEVVEEKK